MGYRTYSGIRSNYWCTKHRKFYKIYPKNKPRVKYNFYYNTNVKPSKITIYLLLLSLLGSFFIVIKGNIFSPTSIAYLIWNLFLAWIPYIISSCWIKKETSSRTFIPLFVIWIIFFPNAPYIVTDIIHVTASAPGFLWYNSLIFFLFGWTGLLLGMISLFDIHTWIQTHTTTLKSEIIIFLICALSSFGIYIGRVERLNSWDLFFRPLETFRTFHSTWTHSNTIMFIAAYTIFMYAIYKTISVLLKNQNNSVV